MLDSENQAPGLGEAVYITISVRLTLIRIEFLLLSSTDFHLELSYHNPTDGSSFAGFELRYASQS